MVNIQIFCSEIFSDNGSIIGSGDFYRFEDFLNFAKERWIRRNISSETHECSALASVPNAPEGFPDQLCLGLFVFHYNRRKDSHQIYISHTGNDDFIEAFENLGMTAKFQNHLPEDDLFRSRFDFLQNLNNPHRLLGSWIKKLDDDLDVYELIEKEKGLPEASDEMAENSLLSTVLRFAKSHNKEIEMLSWLGSKEGQKFLNYFDASYSVGPKLANAANHLLKSIKSADKSDFEVDAFISRFESLSIPEPVLF